MRLLLCNDDGIDAPGLAALEAAARRLSDDVWIVAPDAKRTAAGHSLTIARPLTLEERGHRRYASSGTPADCVIAAMAWLFEGGQKPDLVLSGINDGRNVAEDIAYSGTLAIAREATFWNVPAIAFSRVKNPATSPQDDSFIAGLIGKILSQRDIWLPEDHWLGINLPASLPAAVSEPRIGRDKIGGRAEVLGTEGRVTTLVLPRGRPHVSSEGDENDLIDRGHVTINRLNWFGETRIGNDLLSGLAGD